MAPLLVVRRSLRSLALLVLLGLAGCLEPTFVPEPETVGPTRVEQVQGLLWSGTQRIDVVVHAQPGYEPAATSVEAVEREFGRLTGKPVQVTVRIGDYAFADDKVWTAAELDALRDPLLAEPWPDGVALVHVLAIAGCYRFSDDRPCIAAIAGRMATIFPREAEGDTVPHEPVLRDVPLYGWYHAERYLYVHELGHVFGLVASPLDQVTPRLSNDTCLCHSDDNRSVMGLTSRGWRIRLSPDRPEEIAEIAQQDNFQWHTFSEHDLADVRAFQLQEPAGAGMPPSLLGLR